MIPVRVAVALSLAALAAEEARGREPLGFEERVDLAMRLELVLDARRDAPENRTPKAPFEVRVRREAVAARVERDLMAADALGTVWGAPIGAVQMQSEMRRLGSRTRDPGLLREMLSALGNDPYLIAECLARPAIARREVANRYPRDRRIHGEAKERAELLRASLSPGTFGAAGGVERVRHRVRDGACPSGDGAVDATAEELSELGRRLPPCGEIGQVEETASAFLIRRRGCDGEPGELVVETIRVAKQPVDEWLASLPRTAGWRTPGIDGVALVVPPVGEGGASDFGDEGPLPMRDHTAVWTGSEMLVFGVEGGQRYDPATDTWRPMSDLNEPERRSEHLAVWTGTDMIVWGGSGTVTVELDTGGRYDPAADSWQATSMAGAPSKRRYGTMVWTGAEAIVYGGYSQGASAYYGDGAAYRPATDTWTAIATGPVRFRHTAVWTGTEMLVWGGGDPPSTPQQGARYDPISRIWTSMAVDGATPEGRAWHTALWSGSRLLVWGGLAVSGYTSSGGMYDPLLDAWVPMSTATAPSPRSMHSSVWTGARMLVWGGIDSSSRLETGGAYDPVADTWSTTSLVGAPAARDAHTAVWTGAEMLVWGGSQIYPINTGGRYDPKADAWAAMSTGAWAPTDRQQHTAVWTGAEMIVFGGWDDWNQDLLGDGGRYAPVTDNWEPLSTLNSPSPRESHVAVWSGTEMLVSGGGFIVGLNVDGGRYDPASDSWQPLPPMPVEPGRRQHTAIWSGTEMIVWGGDDFQANMRQSGGRFDPVTSTWTTTKDDATTPWPRTAHTAIWTGSRMVIWGGSLTAGRNDGGRYDPATDTWQPTSLTGAPAGRYDHTAVWTGTEMIVWGGFNGIEYRTGGRYNPVADSWIGTSTAGAPVARYRHAAVWTGTEMVVWGGNGAAIPHLDSGGRYDPGTNTWQPTTLQDAPLPAEHVAAVWTGKEMIVTGYGDRTCCAGTPWYHVNGGRYEPAADRWNEGFGSDPPLGENVLAGKPPGAGSPFHGAGIRGYRVDGDMTPTIVSAFPEHVGYGVRVASGDVEAGGFDEVVAAPGPGPAFPPRVRGFDRSGTRLAGFDFLAYGTADGGANVGAGRIDSGDRVLTGPGPSPAYGPHVRSFRYAGGAVSSLAKVSFYAYGTLRHGVNVAAGDVEGDGFEEIVTGAGPGAVFGPHVRGFDYDGAAVRAMAKVSFFAYGTLRYGVEAGAGDVDGDGFDEILTGPGPSAAFASQLRGFGYDGLAVTAMAKVNAYVFPGSRHGMNVASGDLENDGYDEIACGAGPDPAFGTLMVGLQYDGASLAPIGALGLDVYGLRYGLRVACGAMGW